MKRCKNNKPWANSISDLGKLFPNTLQLKNSVKNSYGKYFYQILKPGRKVNSKGIKVLSFFYIYPNLSLFG